MKQPAKQLYDDAEIYHRLMGSPPSPATVAFYQRLAERFGQPVLELGCGSGRITRPLARAGIDIVGLDTSPAMLALARDGEENDPTGARFLPGDMRDIDVDQTFGFVFAPTQCFQHLLTRVDVERCLAAVAEHLEPGGALLIQAFVPSPAILAKSPDEWSPTRASITDGDGEPLVAELCSAYEPASQILSSIYRIGYGPGRWTHELRLTMRQFFPQELDTLLHYNGYEILERFSDEDFTPFDQAPQYQNILCRPRR